MKEIYMLGQTFWKKFDNYVNAKPCDYVMYSPNEFILGTFRFHKKEYLFVPSESFINDSEKVLNYYSNLFEYSKVQSKRIEIEDAKLEDLVGLFKEIRDKKQQLPDKIKNLNSQFGSF